MTDQTVTYKKGSYVADGNISSVADFAALTQLKNIKPVAFNIKKADGSSPLPQQPVAPEPTPPSSTNPNDYIITGGDPQVSNLNVDKIFFDRNIYYFLAKNGDNVNFVVLQSSREKMKFVYWYSGLVKGDISEATDDNTSRRLTQRLNNASGYILRKKDGSETYSP